MVNEIPVDQGSAPILTSTHNKEHAWILSLYFNCVLFARDWTPFRLGVTIGVLLQVRVLQHVFADTDTFGLGLLK